ncbi:MAG: hypothetical protein WCF90_07670 [Methanomicrobiales archaeon]
MEPAFLPKTRAKYSSAVFGKVPVGGLFIVAEILLSNGMTVQETGEPGKGSRFKIRIPPEHFRESAAPQVPSQL